MITVTDLSKSYGSVQALQGVSFHVDAGEIIGLLGPNGAGKTTMMKILTGYLQPSGGTAEVDGLDVLTQALQVQQRIGYLPETAPLYPELSVQESLKMIADLRQIPDDEQPARLSRAIRATILDEPTIGLDPTQIVEVRNLIRSLAGNSTVLLSTHILSEVEAICDRVIILLNGEIKADARLADLEATTDVILVLEEGAPDASADLLALEGVRSVEATPAPGGLVYRVQTTDSLDLRPAIYALARDEGWPLLELRRDQRTLETVFGELASAGGGDTE
jgi:ABC-2 type transport system ATP-binding protein